MQSIHSALQEGLQSRLWNRFCSLSKRLLSIIDVPNSNALQWKAINLCDSYGMDFILIFVQEVRKLAFKDLEKFKISERSNFTVTQYSMCFLSSFHLFAGMQGRRSFLMSHTVLG